MQNRRANIPMREEKQRGPVSGSDVQIHAVKRFCAASDCSNEISGHTGQYCCHACYQRDYYRRHKKKIAKQRAARSVKRMLSPKSVEIMSATPASSKKKPVPATIPETKKQNHEEPLSTDMLSVSEAAKRLKVCRQTLYNLEAAGTIRILHLTSRLSFIRWSDLLALFDAPEMCGKPVARPNKRLKRSVRQPNASKRSPANGAISGKRAGGTMLRPIRSTTPFSGTESRGRKAAKQRFILPLIWT